MLLNTNSVQAATRELTKETYSSRKPRNLLPNGNSVNRNKGVRQQNSLKDPRNRLKQLLNDFGNDKVPPNFMLC